MVVIKIELWPFGFKENAREIGRMHISNDTTGDKVKGNYKVKLFHTEKYSNKPGIWKQGVVKGHLRKLSPYHLILKALQNTLSTKKDTVVNTKKDLSWLTR